MSTGNRTAGSLTPLSRADEVTKESVNEGYLAALATLVPSTAAVMFALKQYPNFAAKTNWQSRTALIIMPPLFAFALTSEMRVGQKMEQMASEAQHAKDLQEWHHKERKPQMFRYAAGGKDEYRDQTTDEMLNMYRKSIENSGVRIVPGDSLSFHHVASNFVQEHPFKLLTVVGVPSVAYILWSKNHQGHLQVQQQLMHTRVMGQGVVIGLLLSFMGFKTYMDVYGKFITEADMNARVEDMQLAREHFLAMLEKSKNREKYIKELEMRVAEEDAKEKAEKMSQNEASNLVQDK